MTLPPDDPFPDHPEDDFQIPYAGGKRYRRYLRFMGEVKSTVEWAKEYGQTRFNLCVRLAQGWSIENAITTPTRLQKTRRRLRAVKHLIEHRSNITIEDDGTITERPPRPRTSRLPGDLVAMWHEARELAEKLNKQTAVELEEALAKEFGERKFQACRRLQSQGDYEKFVALKRMYQKHAKQYGMLKHIPFYLALEHFPPNVKPDISDL